MLATCHANALLRSLGSGFLSPVLLWIERVLPRLIPALCLFCPGVAFAGAESVDIELSDPSWSPHSLPGVDSAFIEGRGALRVGALSQIQSEPLLLYVRGREQGSAISQRLVLQPGFSYDWSSRLSARALLPLLYQSGAEVPALSADGVGIRDPRVGLRLGLATAGPFATALRGDVRFPVGTRGSWMGENYTHAETGILVSAETQWADFLVDLGVNLRRPIPTGLEFRLGNEIVTNVGARVRAWPGRLALTGALMGRGSSERPWALVSESPLEWQTGIEAQPNQGLTVNIGVGTGIYRGYGATSIRGLLGVSWSRAPIARSKTLSPLTATPALEVFSAELVPEVREKVAASLPWRAGELARVEERRIEIREPIRFEFGTARILPESRPVLDALAQTLSDYWQLAHVVIVGHASEEGSFAYNDELSVARARSIFRALVESGIHPSRLSYRGMGEVLPSAPSSAEPDLVKNRRVEFHIVHLLDAVEAPPVYEPEILLPWTGELVKIKASQGRILGVTPETSSPDTPSAPVDLIEQYLREEAREPGEPPAPGPAPGSSPPAPMGSDPQEGP